MSYCLTITPYLPDKTKQQQMPTAPNSLVPHGIVQFVNELMLVQALQYCFATSTCQTQVCLSQQDYGWSHVIVGSLELKDEADSILQALLLTSQLDLTSLTYSLSKAFSIPE